MSVNNVRVLADGIGAFRPGACFTGVQKSKNQCYQVTVDLKDVSLSNSHASGYIKIKGLTEELTELTTFFDAEIIGSQYSFLTRKWDADEKIDRMHWLRFPGFKEDSFNTEKHSYEFTNQPYIFMRWKEHFLVPDHKITTVNGASFAGFYYACFETATGTITGFYFHQNSEWFQELRLEYVNDASFDSFEFR